MEDFRHNYVNLTGFRLVRYEEPVVRDAIKQMRSYERFSRDHLLNTTTLIKVKPGQVTEVSLVLKVEAKLGLAKVGHFDVRIPGLEMANRDFCETAVNRNVSVQLGNKRMSVIKTNVAVNRAITRLIRYSWSLLRQRRSSARFLDLIPPTQHKHPLHTLNIHLRTNVSSAQINKE